MTIPNDNSTAEGITAASGTKSQMESEVEVPDSDAWWLKRLYELLTQQRVYCQSMLDRFYGEAPLPYVSDIQRDAVKWFVGQSRTNFERLIVNSVLSRLRIKGIRTSVGDGDEGDDDAWKTWKNSRGKIWAHEVMKLALAASRAYVIVGKDAEGNLLVTAEDPRMVCAITDPENPYRVLAGMKVYFDYVDGTEKTFLYRPGRAPRVAVRRSGQPPVTETWFQPRAYEWIDASLVAPEFDANSYVVEDPTGGANWLAAQNGLPALCPIVPFVNEDGLSQFEPFLPLVDRINQQILQRMTIATIQAFKQRAFKGLPQKDPSTGKDIDYDSIFVADPGAIWNIPASAEIWESGQVDLQPILLAIRDDVKDLAAVSGTPLYSISPDVANGSAEGASLQREQMSFLVETRQDNFGISLEMVNELMFRTLGDIERSKPGSTEVMWAQSDRPSMAERGSTIAQTTGVIPRYQQLTEIWGMSPTQAKRALIELRQDFLMDQQFAAAATPTAPTAPPAPGQSKALGAQQQAAKATAQAQPPKMVGSEGARAAIQANRPQLAPARSSAKPKP
jgi:hypothetical protein